MLPPPLPLCVLALVLSAGASGKDNSERLAQLAKDAESATVSCDTSKAIALLQTGLKLEPDWKEGLWAMAVAAYRSGDYAGGQSRLNRLATIDPSRGEAWALLGLCEFELRQYENAAHHLRRGTALGIPSRLELADVARFRLASSEIMLENYDVAQWILLSLCSDTRSGAEREDLTGLLGAAALHLPALAPNSSVARAVGEAMFLGASGDPAGASRLFTDLIAKYPATPLLHCAYATFLLNQSDYPAAERELRRELAVDPRSFSARLGLGFTGLQADDAAKYLPFAAEAVALKPGSYLARLYKGRLLLKAGRAKDGALELESARDLSPSATKVHFFLAAAYRTLGREADAKRERDEFARLQPLVPGERDSR